MSIDFNTSLELARLEAGNRSGKGSSMEKVAAQFEALFIQQLLSVMQKTVGTGGLFEGSAGQDIYQSMMNQALSGSIAESGGLGLAQPIREYLDRVGGDSSEIDDVTVPEEVRESLQSMMSEAERHFRLSSEVGWRRDPFSGDWKYHHGVDLAAAKGTPVGSLAEGRVVFSGVQGGYGNTVVVEDQDGTRVRYAHLSELNVKQGDRIGKGETLGKVGSTGKSTGPHLHVEVEKGGRMLDPLG